MEELLLKLKENNFIDDETNIILEKYDNGTYQSVDQDTFKGFFNGTDYSYDQLKQADQGKGYTRFFDKWHGLGII